MKLPPIPIRAPLTGGDGRINGAWARWFTTLYEMVGVSGPASSDDVESILIQQDNAQVYSEISNLNDAVDDLSLRVAMLDTATQEQTSTGSAYGNYIEIDFGSTPVYDASFSITDALISVGSIVLVTTGGAATGRTADDWQWDGASVGVVAGSGSATCYAQFTPGPIVGKRKFNYTVI